MSWEISRGKHSKYQLSMELDLLKAFFIPGLWISLLKDPWLN